MNLASCFRVLGFRGLGKKNRVPTKFRGSEKKILGPLMFLAILTLIFLPADLARSAPGPSGERREVQEYELKAVYLYNFLHFVTWPERHCGLSGKQIRQIAIVGENPFGDVLQALQAKLEKEHLSLVFYGPYRKGMDLGDCCILFISETEKDNVPEIIASLGEDPVLTVSDVDGFIDAGGMVAFVPVRHRIRWFINRRPVQRAGLRLSAKFLDIALEVVER